MTHKLWHTSTLYCIQLEINLIYLIGIIDQWKKTRINCKKWNKIVSIYFILFWILVCGLTVVLHMLWFIYTHYSMRESRNRLPWWTPAWRPAVRHFENWKILSRPWISVPSARDSNFGVWFIRYEVCIQHKHSDEHSWVKCGHSISELNRHGCLQSVCVCDMSALLWIRVVCVCCVSALFSNGIVCACDVYALRNYTYVRVCSVSALKKVQLSVYAPVTCLVCVCAFKNT